MEESAKVPTPIASPARSPAQPEPAQAEQSPGQGSGTKEGKVEITGTGNTPVKDTVDVLAKATTPEAKPTPSSRGKDPVPYSELLALESMSMLELCEEYFTRLAQHKNLEGDLVNMMQKHHKVVARVIYTFCMFVLIRCIPQALSL